ncbi:hypothetical protein MBLNU459_g7140t1 [Dothideomycetes sp. NU459]
MMDDAWYNAFVHSAAPKEDAFKHRRRSSLLQQPNDVRKTDAPVDALPDVAEDLAPTRAPPAATVPTRAQSYSDFHRISHNPVRAERRLERRTSLHVNLALPEAIRSDLDFASWCGGFEDDLLDTSHEEYTLYQEQLQLSRDHLDSLLASTTSTLNLLSSLSENFKAVEAQTTAFQAQCESLISEQRRITKLADDVDGNLQYYAYLEPMTRRLNAPGAANLVRSKEFPEMLSNLDSCLEYMQSHPTHREAPTYRSRYRLLLTRALTLIRVHFTNSLRSLAADVSQRIADKQLNDTTQSALLYAKFRVGAPELKALGMEIQKRALLSAGADQGGEAEYQSLINELYQSYAATRGRLLVPIITRKMGEIAAVDTAVGDLVTFARTAIGFIRGICLDEYDLWDDWFSGDGGVYEFLEAICEPLYDHLRPRTIKETRILKLCELCTFIQTRYVEADEDDDLDSSSEIAPKRALNFAALIQPALEDAQTRLVFLALAILRDDIENYRPKPEDLDYPAHATRSSATTTNGRRVPLSGRKGSVNGMPQTPTPKTPMIVDEDDGVSVFESQWSTEPDQHSTASYPTLRKAVWLLSRIYRLVNSTVFDDLAHNIVHSTTMSLVSATSQIASRASPTDANLFLISHLLRLKQQIVAFDIEFVTPEVGFDFSSVTNTFYELRDRGGLWNPASWVKLVGGGLMPRVVENMLDAKAELDGRLRAVINDFVNSFAARITAPLTHMPPAKAGTDAGAEANKATMAVRAAAQKEIVFLRRKVDEYIEDARTRETLVAAVRDQVILAYEDWIDRMNDAKGKVKIGKVSKKGKGREDEVWGSDVFADWCERTFAVGTVVGDGDESEDAGT